MKMTCIVSMGSVVASLFYMSVYANQNTVDAQSDISFLQKNIEKIDRIEIYQIFPDTNTRAPVSPDKLDRTFDKKLILNSYLSHGINGELINKLGDLQVSTTVEVPNLRWAIRLHYQEDNKYKQLITFYVTSQ